VVARTTTDADGRWFRPVMLFPETYAVIFFKQDAYGPDRRDAVVA
jgi:hypothetical protein